MNTSKPQMTIVDILRKGNQELFHSSMIAWLCNPVGEHQLGWEFLRHFSAILEDQGHSMLGELLESSPTLDIATEVVTKGGRHDISLTFDDYNIVIENKTKTVGNKAQLKKYGEEADFVIPLGLTKISFSKDVPFLITYKDILGILDELVVSNTQGFGVLVKHYQDFLQRELGFLEDVLSSYQLDDSSPHLTPTVYAEQVRYFTENDKRFVHLFLLEHFRRNALVEDHWSTLNWSSSKNEQSGVWIAVNHRSLTPRPWLRDISAEIARFWLHLELRNGIFASSANDPAGVIQLRCSTSGDNSNLFSAFQSQYQTQPNERFPHRTPQSNWGSFFVLQKQLKKKELSFPTLKDRLTNFGDQFFNLKA